MSGWAARRYALGRTTRRIAARPFAFLFSVASAAAALFVPMFVTAVVVPMWPLPIRLAVEPEISVFVTPGTGGAEIKSLTAKLSGVPAVADVKLITRDAALAELTSRSGVENAAAAVAELKSNPLPDVLVARLRGGTSADAIDELSAGVRKWARVDFVAADTGWYRKWAQWWALLVAAAMTLAALGAVVLLWVVVSAVRLQAGADRDEVRALQLVGADARFLRRPYVYLGAATTGLAMALALGATAFAIRALSPEVATLAALYGLSLAWAQPPPAFFGFAWLGACVLGGVIAGWGVRFQPDRIRD